MTTTILFASRGQGQNVYHNQWYFATWLTTMNYCLYSISQVHLPFIWYMSLNTRAWQNSWWRQQMETFFALLAICAGNLPVTGEFPAQTPVTRSFDVFFYLRVNKGWVKNREAGDLRRHCAHYGVIVMFCRDSAEVRSCMSYYIPKFIRMLEHEIRHWCSYSLQATDASTYCIRIEVHSMKERQYDAFGYW